jgi:hypothetical protein
MSPKVVDMQERRLIAEILAVEPRNAMAALNACGDRGRRDRVATAIWVFRQLRAAKGGAELPEVMRRALADAGWRRGDG